MIPRYSLPEMAAVWSEQRKLAVWQEIEALVGDALTKLGVAPEGTGDAIRAAEPVASEELAERERVTHHDVAAFVDLLADRSADAGRWVHYGLTASDVIDTANGVLMAEASKILLTRLEDLFDVVRARALEHRGTEMVGRTHGVWAEPITFGLKLSTWAFELARDHRRLSAAHEAVAVGKVSGAVGTYAHLAPDVEHYVCDRLQLTPEPASSQITMRDRPAELLGAIALTGASIERFATEIRHLARSEVGEVQEAFAADQKGSSSMPHKRNPVISERMVGLARVLRGYAQVGFENVALWHERDISHSSAERVVVPDACLALHYMCVTFTDLIRNLVVDRGRMRRNLASTRGLVYSQTVLGALLAEGMTRDDAYRLVQRNAAAAVDQAMDLQESLAKDPDVSLTSEELADCFSSQHTLRNAGVVFDRLESLTIG